MFYAAVQQVTPNVEPTEFRHNHYVPRWYQERFLPAERPQRELYYLHKEPRTRHDSRGRRIALPEVEPRALKNCFAEHDLYTVSFRGITSTDLERLFFGEMDRQGRKAVAYWTDYDHTTYGGDALQSLLIYLSTQKLRTPKGLRLARPPDRQPEPDDDAWCGRALPAGLRRPLVGVHLADR